jgi:hypothetical protein
MLSGCFIALLDGIILLGKLVGKRADGRCPVGLIVAALQAAE